MFSHDEWNDRLMKQEALEEFASTEGRERFFRRLEKAQAGGRGSTTGGVKKLLAEAIDPTEKAILWAVEDAKGKRGRRHYALRWVEDLGADVAAFLTARVILDGLHEGKRDLKHVARHVSRLILHELRYRRFREEAPGLFHYRMNSFDTQSYAHRSRSLNAAMSYAEVDVSDIDMPQNERILVGTWLLDKFTQSTGLVETLTETSRTGRKVERRLWLVPAEGTLEWVEKRNDVLAELQPVKMPMLVPPLPWRKGDRGGYRFKLRGQYPMVRGWSRKDTVAEDHEMPVVYGALNRLQDTAWTINRDVYDVIRVIERKGGGMCGLPSLENEPEPTLWDTYVSMRGEGALPDVTVRDGKADGPEDQVKALTRAHRYAVGQVKDRNYYRFLDDLAHRKVMQVAAHMVDEGAFFFPYNVDFRGRIYPISDYLSPQGADIEKGLLTFADKRPMGALGGKWLAIHTMNCLDETPQGQKVSKMTLIERQTWVEDHLDAILRVARDPFGDTWWMDADEPFQFYAACCEWARWEEHDYSPDHLCGLPVAMDGSCNGLQHFAAMFRDEYGATAVNVTPNERPNDVYALVAESVLDRLQRDYEETGDEMARLWLASGLVDRKLCKRPTMTFGYGSKPFGFTNQLVEYLQKDTPWAQTEAHFEGVNTETGEVESRVFEACNTMAWHIWEALGDVVVKAFEGMEWLQACASAVAAEGKPVEWVVPCTGFPVTQGYFQANLKQVRTILAGTMIRPSFYEDTDKIEVHKQTNGIAPNVIHSLDAAALMLTVKAASDEGIEAFGMVHDSYATVPGDAQDLAEITRQEFVHLYEQNVAGDLFRQWIEQAPSVPTPPESGRLDLYGVLVSDYFFA